MPSGRSRPSRYQLPHLKCLPAFRQPHTRRFAVFGLAPASLSAPIYDWELWRARWPDLSFCGVPRDADWTLVIPEPMLRVGSALLGFSHMQPEHALDVEICTSVQKLKMKICTSALLANSPADNDVTLRAHDIMDADTHYHYIVIEATPDPPPGPRSQPITYTGGRFDTVKSASAG